MYEKSHSTVGLVGSIMAVIMSYSVNSSILWGLLHFSLGWIYVVYWMLSYTNLINWIKEFVIK
jgi:hypothetical protein